MIRRWPAALCLLAFLLVLFPVPGPSLAARLVATDGDSLRLGSERLRLLGVDAPELFSPRCPAEYQAAVAARDFVAALLSSGGPIEVERHGLDKYRRTLVVVRVGGRDLGDALIASGHARPYQRGRRLPWCSTP